MNQNRLIAVYIEPANFWKSALKLENRNKIALEVFFFLKNSKLVIDHLKSKKNQNLSYCFIYTFKIKSKTNNF